MTFLQKACSRRAVLIGCYLWLAILLLPLFGLCFYAYPAYDDIVHIRAAGLAYAESGRIADALQAAWSHTVDMYQTWQGTYTAMFFSSFQPLLFSTKLYFLTPLSMLVLLLLSAGCFCHELRGLLRLQKTEGFLLFTLLVTLLLTFAPGLRESLYWLSGCPYLLGIILLFLLAGCLIRTLRPLPAKLPRIGLGIALLLLGFLAGGCPYPVALGTLVGCGCFCCRCFWRKKPAKALPLLALLGLLSGLVLVLLAPGNAVRQAKVGSPMHPLTALVYSLAQALQEVGKWCTPQLLAVVLLCALLLLKPLSECGLRFRNPFWFSFFSFGTLTAAFVPPIFATGAESYLVERVYSSLYLFFVPVFLCNVLYWLGWFSTTVPCCRKLSGSGLPVWSVLTAAGLIVLGMFAQGILATPPVSAARSLLNGEAAAYHRQLTEREAALCTAESYDAMAAQIQPLTAQPPLLYADRLPSQVTASPGVVRQTAQLLYLQEQARRFGAGSIPAQQLMHAEAIINPN